MSLRGGLRREASKSRRSNLKVQLRRLLRRLFEAPRNDIQKKLRREFSSQFFLLPISRVQDVVRLSDPFDARALQLHQLTDVQVVMRHPAGEHLAR